MAMRSKVLSVYRACMRSAQKCPEWENCEMMKSYVRMKFRHEKDTQDPARIRQLIEEAQDELNSMEYYHSVYKAKQDEKNKTMIANSGQDVVKHACMFINKVCPGCGLQFHATTDRFCSNCGMKRT